MNNDIDDALKIVQKAQENAELKDILLNIVNHSKELVASGVAEALNKKYFDK